MNQPLIKFGVDYNIDFISKYLINERMEEWYPYGVAGDENTDEEAFLLIYDEYYSNVWPKYVPSFWRGDKLPWEGRTCLTVLHYVLKLDIDDEMHDLIRDLNYLVFVYRKAKRLNLEEESQQIKETICYLLVNEFMPMAQEFFQVPMLNEVNVKDVSLKENELLASYLDFLLQILNSQSLINLDEEHKYDLLQKELTFLLSMLGDMPFMYSQHDDVGDILGEIETLANEAGNFIYSCVFTLHPIMANIYIEGQRAILEMVEILNIKIKEHCMNFSNHNSTVVSPTNHVMDSTYIVDSLIQDLENLMENQIHLIVDELKVEIRNLHEELMISRSLLTDVGRAQDSDHMDELNESTAQVRDVAYEAEYLINSYVVGNLPFWYLNLRLPVVFPKLKFYRKRLQETMMILDIRFLDIKKDFGKDVSNQTEGAPMTKVNDIVVGFEAESVTISDELCGGRKDRRTITISGMPGIGKTTIANKLFNDRLIIDHFDERGSCVVSQTYKKRNVLIDILKSLSKSNIKKENISEMDDDKLSLMIHQCLKNRRYLIFMDDIWSENVWDELQRFFPDDGNGSRIMLTSRVRGISPPNSFVHSLPLLTKEQCWSLLETKVFPKETCPPQLQSIGKRIASKCGGLPLTIVVTAGVLINLENEESVWEKVEKNLDSYIFSSGSGINDYSKILELSFKHLPNHLKMCFLYVGAFREDKLFGAKLLTQLWISEGFIQREQEKSLDLVAEEYLKELIDRSLILIAIRKSDGRIKACRIHDQLRKMCIRKSREVSFSTSLHHQNYSIYEKNQRMFDNSVIETGSKPFGLYYRSFLGYLPHPSSKLPQMKLLRVMDLQPVSDSSFEMKKVNLLVQLRYLCLNKMPKPIHENFVNLEFLFIYGPYGSEIVPIPLVILKLVKLSYLHIQNGAIFEEDCYNCQRSSSLRYFSNINIHNDKDSEVLRCLPHLVKLKCYYFNPTLFPDLHSHTDLRILTLSFHSHFGGELAKVNFPSTITNLKLNDLGLTWEEISMIGRLPKLRVLKLLNRAFVGEIWETRKDEFQGLIFLRIEGNDVIKEWITSSDHFPQLECLEVIDCINLKEIPSEIGEILTLQMIKVYNSGDGAYSSAVEIVEEQHENGNEELQLETRNDMTMEELIQNYQKRNLEIQEDRWKYDAVRKMKFKQ